LGGTVHVELGGAIDLSQDLALRECAVYVTPRIAATYLVTAYPDDGLGGVMVTVSRYRGPGVYSFEPVGTMHDHPHRGRGLVTVRMQGGLRVVEQARSRVYVAVSERETRGAVLFKHYTTDRGGEVSGTITWCCDASDNALGPCEPCDRWSRPLLAVSGH